MDALAAAGYTPSLIVTVPDKPSGRGLELTAPAVKVWAVDHDVTCIQPASLKEPSAELDMLINTEWDVFIVAAYGKLLPQQILDLPRLGVLNVHPSLLPKFRGPSPIESQILSDEREVGVSVIFLDEQMDHGPVLAAARIQPEVWPMTAADLEEVLWTEGGSLIAEVLPQLEDGTAVAAPQDDSLATFTQKIVKSDGLIDLSADGYQNYLKYCAYVGWPGTYFITTKNGKELRVKINTAEFRDGVFTPLTVTPEGRREISYSDFTR